MNLIKSAVIATILMPLSSFASEAKDMHTIQSAKIMRIEKSSYSNDSRITLRIPSEIPLNYWVNCDYYNRESEIIASTNHSLLKRVPTWTVKAKPEDIYFVLCWVPKR